MACKKKEAAEDGPSASDPVLHVRDSDGIPGACPQLDPVLSVEAT